MAEVQFLDGKFVVDDVYVGPIKEATNGSPERFPFKDVMKSLGDVFTKDYLRRAQAKVVGDHLRRFGG